MNVGDKIKESRRNKKLTQKALAEKIGKSERMVQKYESGEVIPPHNVLRDIARALDVPVFALQTISPEDMAAIKNSISGTNSTFAKAFEALGPVINKLGSLGSLMKEMADHDIAYLLLHKEKAFYNGQPLTEEERRRILDMLKLLFPEYSEGLDDQEKEGE